MNWEETIRFIRTQPEYRELIQQSYLDEDLKMNVERFRVSAEFEETIGIIKEFAPNADTILDIGSGNGISAVAFALAGYQVTVAEPDPSLTVGCGAIEKLKAEYSLDNLRVVAAYAEQLPFGDDSFNIVYARQAMHHAADLDAFMQEAARVLKPGGLMLTIRDHVIFSEKDKEQFLLTHPLQKFYGGENAFTVGQYTKAMRKAGLRLKKKLRYYDSAINYFPFPESEIRSFPRVLRENFRKSMQKRFGSWAVNFPFLHLLELISQIKSGKWTDERRIPGRMNSFIALKDPL